MMLVRPRPWFAAATSLLLAATAIGAGAATAAAATAGTTGPVGSAVSIPGTVEDNPVPEYLLSAGADGFLHVADGVTASPDFFWTTYGPNPSSTSLGVLGVAHNRLVDAGWFGAGSDVVAAYQRSSTTQATVTLTDMGNGGATSTVQLGALQYGGTYGDTVIGFSRTGTSPLADSVHLLRPDGSGGTTDTVVTGAPSGDSFYIEDTAGDATTAMVQYRDSASQWHQLVVDLATGVGTPVAISTALVAPDQVTFTPTTIVTTSTATWVGVYSLADLSAAPQSVTVTNLQRPLNGTAAAQVGDSVLTLGPVGGSLWSSPLNGGSATSPLQLVQDQILETPDGGALVEGTPQAPTAGSWNWGFYRFEPGQAAPQEAAPMQSVAVPSLGMALYKGKLTLDSANPAELSDDQLTTRTVNAQATPPVSAPTVVESLPGLSGAVSTGDGQVAFDYNGQPAKTDGTPNSFSAIIGASGRILDADGKYTLTGSGSSVQAGDFSEQELLGDVQSSPTGAASVWGGYAYVGESTPAGAVGVIDLAKQRVAATLSTGAPCSVTDVQVTDRWLYWVCDTHTAGVYDLATGARFVLPATASGYDDALLGDGYLVYHDPAAQQLVVDDIHTDQLVSSSAFATPAQGTATADRRTSWTVDRYSPEVAWQDGTGSYNVAPVDVPASAGWTFHYTAPTVPAWLLPLAASNENMTQWRECTGIRISPIRVLATADCYLGHGNSYTDWSYNSAGELSGGGSGPTYLLDQRYNASTRQDDLSVTGSAYGSSTSVAPLAGASDSALYRTGTAATFYSWSGLGWNGGDGIRTPHSESTVLDSAATCAALLGHALPTDSICTSPAPGSLSAAQDHCTGDAGGALVAGGKVIATAATSATGCSAAGVRVYTAIAPKAALVVGWGRDLGVNEVGYSFGGIVARSSNGVIYAFCGSNMNSCLNQGVGSLVDGSEEYNEVIPAGAMDGAGVTDVLARTKSGALYRFWGLGYSSGDLDGKDKTWLGNGWNAYRTILVPGDLTGDGISDVVAVDASGVMWLYPGTAKGGLGARIRMSGGWNAYNLITGGDVTGDGIADLVVRDKQGKLWTYVGNGKGYFQTHRVYAGAGWGGFNSLVLGGDLDLQGHEQLIGRATNGIGYLYTSNGAGGFTYNGAVGTNSWYRSAALT